MEIFWSLRNQFVIVSRTCTRLASGLVLAAFSALSSGFVPRILACVLALIIFGSSTLQAARLGHADKRLEDLFISRASEVLKLPPSEQQAFTDVIKKLGVRKRKIGEDMSETMKSLEAVKTKKETERVLKHYRSLLDQYHAVQTSEYDQLKKLLGTEQFAQYLVVKRQIYEKLKGILSEGGQTNAGSENPPEAPQSSALNKTAGTAPDEKAVTSDVTRTGGQVDTKAAAVHELDAPVANSPGSSPSLSK